MEHRGTPDIERFSRWAGGYEHAGFQRFIGRIHDAMLATAAAESSPPKSILDVGCGTGRFLRKAGHRWPTARLVGVDPAEGMITVASRLAPAVSFYVAPAESIPVAPASIDLAFSAISLHHWADQLEGVREVARALRPGGLVCLADIAVPRWLAKFLRSKAQNAEGIRQLVTQAGLNLQKQRHILAHSIFIVLARRPGTATCTEAAAQQAAEAVGRGLLPRGRLCTTRIVVASRAAAAYGHPLGAGVQTARHVYLA